MLMEVKVAVIAFDRIIRKDESELFDCGYLNADILESLYPSPMDEIQKFIARNFRRILAAGGLLLSLVALSILLNNSPQGSVWMASHPIPNGGKITSADVQLVKVDLASNSAHYLSATTQVVGQFATRAIRQGDLIAVTDVSHQSSNSTANFLPIGVATNDLPSDLAVGDLVDIYIIPKDQASLPALVAHRISVQNIDQRSRTLGGAIGVSLSTSASIATVIVTAEAQGRLVLARDPI
jgi:hypothetical protein